jgi:carboxylate-amine ligase
VCGDRAGYERTIDELVAVGTVSDESYIYWHVRPSSRYPTLELRVGDVCLTADESVALAGLFRSLVRTTHAALSGPAPGDASHEMLRAATWRASRHGLDGPLVDVLRREEVPAALLVRRLLTHLRPDLIEHGEWEAVSERVEAVLDRGNGARRQRAELRRTGNLQEVTKMIVQSTNGGRLPGCGPLGADPATGAAA